MFISAAHVKDWRELQERVCRLFIEMDYEAESEKTVALAGRGKKQIDVFVNDLLASYNRTYLIECKYWDVNVPQEVVHAFKTVMEETGANTGFIVSKKGFQPGAYEASRFTNIKLLTFDELQHLYGNEWFRKQSAKLDVQKERLGAMRSLHFDPASNICIFNNYYFHNKELNERFAYFNLWSMNLFLSIGGISPGSYLGPEPVKIPVDPTDPFSQSEGWYEFPTVRDYFVVMTATAKKCADGFEELCNQAKASFDGLSDNEQRSIRSENRLRSLEETPIRVLKQYVSQREYQQLLDSLRPV